MYVQLIYNIHRIAFFLCLSFHFRSSVNHLQGYICATTELTWISLPMRKIPPNNTLSQASYRMFHRPIAVCHYLDLRGQCSCRVVVHRRIFVMGVPVPLDVDFLSLPAV